MRVVLEPGDGTRYAFLVESGANKEYLWIAGSPRFDLYEYDRNSMLAFFRRYPNTTADLLDLGWMEDSYIQYIADHSKCNVWTARAALMAMKRYMDTEKNNYE